jgi:uncharacterized protein YjgD (DUF1641 family)
MTDKTILPPSHLYLRKHFITDKTSKSLSHALITTNTDNASGLKFGDTIKAYSRRYKEVCTATYLGAAPDDESSTNAPVLWFKIEEDSGISFWDNIKPDTAIDIFSKNNMHIISNDDPLAIYSNTALAKYFGQAVYDTVAYYYFDKEKQLSALHWLANITKIIVDYEIAIIYQNYFLSALKFAILSPNELTELKHIFKESMHASKQKQLEQLLADFLTIKTELLKIAHNKLTDKTILNNIINISAKIIAHKKENDQELFSFIKELKQCLNVFDKEILKNLYNQLITLVRNGNIDFNKPLTSAYDDIIHLLKQQLANDKSICRAPYYARCYHANLDVEAYEKERGSTLFQPTNDAEMSLRL